MSEPTRCGFVAIAGRPNVGKSTLLNRLIGQKISITSRKPQTTRHRLLGVKTLGPDQIVYVDTPGLQIQPTKAMNRYMNRAALSSLEDVDVVIGMVEALKWKDQDDFVLEQLRPLSCPIILAVNKIDRVEPREALMPYLQELASKLPRAEIFPLSARQGENVEALEREVRKYLPESPLLFPEDYVTDRSQRFLAGELIREKLMRALGEELPYQLTVEVEHFGAMREEEGRSTNKKLLHVAATIWVERSGQKRIVIGKQGQVLKQVGAAARAEMESLFAQKIYLQLWVKVRSGWSDDEQSLRQWGYGE